MYTTNKLATIIAFTLVVYCLYSFYCFVQVGIIMRLYLYKLKEKHIFRYKQYFLLVRIKRFYSIIYAYLNEKEQHSLNECLLSLFDNIFTRLSSLFFVQSRFNKHKNKK